MNNGFYNSKYLDIDTKQLIIQDAIFLSSCIRCEVKYKDGNIYRIVDKEASIQEFIKDLSISADNVLDIIDRNMYNDGKIKDEINHGEVCWHSSFNKSNNRDYWMLLYCDMSLSNLNILVNKYNLELINW